MNEPRPPSIGEQIDELAAHIIERHDRLVSDVSRNNAKIDGLRARMAWMIAAAIGFGLLFGAIFSQLARQWALS